MMNFCTLFDSKYLSRGLILYDSLNSNAEDFHLYIFAFDDLTLNTLNSLNLRGVTVISLAEFENEKLISVKGARTRAEYCWTCTSSVINFVLEKFAVSSCTYLDADLFFYASPSILLEELAGEKSVLITEHRFSRFASWFEERRAGRFCVQFITFNNVKESREILLKWIDQCIEWCYSRYEDGKFGDQKYLEKWPEEYTNVYVLKNLGGGVAPWNAGQYRFLNKENKIFLIDHRTKTKVEVVFFHFHFVKIFPEGYADLGWNRLQKAVIELFYIPYILKIIEKEKYLEKSFPGYRTVYASNRFYGMRDTLKHQLKKVTGFNLLKVQ
jgi:hypothetical protein